MTQDIIPLPPRTHDTATVATSPSPPDRPGGFTLLEIMVVIMLLGILAAVVAPAAHDNTSYDLRTETDVLANHLRYAQAMAMGTLKPYGINCDTGTPAGYRLFSATAPATAIALPGESSLNVTLPDGMGLSLSTAGAVICFDAWGVPCSDNAGATPLTADATITVSMNGRSETITVTQLTGFIP